ncbi:hypothetical protein PE36_20465 [Moritella sp. PE36]|nr:hypothetical protein PE36_20465 [Moritella sp. PE36]
MSTSCLNVVHDFIDIGLHTIKVNIIEMKQSQEK